MTGKGITVRRSVLAAALQLESEAEAGGCLTALDIAEQKIGEHENRGDIPGNRFWRSVWMHLMLMKHAPAEIAVLPDDDGYHPTMDTGRGKAG